MPVAQILGEAEMGESLEPWRQRLQGASVVPLHSSLGNRARPCLKKTNKQKKAVLKALNIETVKSVKHFF